MDTMGTGLAASWRVVRGLPDRRNEATGALNGLVGDTLADQGSRLAIPMQVAPAGVRTSRICVLVHGLMASEARWAFKGRPSVTYGSLLAADRGATPVYVTYNSGRHVSTNGRELAGLLDQLLSDWPVPVREVNLIGHSLGGLVVRSACHYGLVEDLPWAALVRRIFLLGTPNRGASLEQVASIVNRGLQALPVGAVRALGRLVDRRSAGIKDLRHGSLVDEDWQLGRRHPVRVPRGAEVFVACGSLLGGRQHLVGKVLGDVLVSQFSAQGRRPMSTGTLCQEERLRVFAGTGHVGLANHPEVYRQILTWWDAGLPLTENP